VAGLLDAGHVRSRGYFDADAVGRLLRKSEDRKVVGFSDNMAFVGILSTMLLDWMYVCGKGADLSELG
jgi:asparagine synthase (glutamine-hydrolysing)